MPLVRAGESQPLLLTARTFSDTPPGVYTADVVLSDGRTERTVALNVRVWDFAIPKEHGLLTLWGTVSRRDIAAVWVAFFSRCEQYRCWAGGAHTEHDPVLSGASAAGGLDDIRRRRQLVWHVLAVVRE